MTVTAENLGGGGSTSFPPPGTQVAVFADTFARPDVGTLGTAWANQWLVTDWPYSENNTPDPMSAALNPRINDNTCTWGSVRGLGGGSETFQGAAVSVAFPWKLAWMTQGQFSQFSEIEILDIDSHRFDSQVSTVSADVVFSGAAGSLTPDTYLQQFPFEGQYGYYKLVIYPPEISGGIPAMQLIWTLFGASPSFAPTGLRGHAGINIVALANFVVAEEPFPSVFRIEAHREQDHWRVQGFQNGRLLTEATDDHLLQGQPAMTCDTPVGWTPQNTPDPQFIAKVRNYRGGML